MEFGLIGRHLEHSFSPELHSRIGDYRYELKELEPCELESFVKSRGFRGLNVTIPYKKAVIPLLDEISPEAAEVGAVNTIVLRDGKLTGYNTDCYGFESMLTDAEVSLRGKNVLILGAGGAALSISTVAQSCGASRIANAVRHLTPDCATEQILYHDIEDEWDVIVNATPSGMFPDDESCPIDLKHFSRIQAVFDCVYNPLRTNLVLAAKSAGLRSAGGIVMLVAQAVKSAELFATADGCPESFSPDSNNIPSVPDLSRELINEKSNLVLIGMPSCGKSTVGRVLAKRLGRRFIDCDALAVERIGMSIQDFFAREGEAAFRAVERELISDISRLQGAVIATGGGAVLDEANVLRLKRNGIVIYLDTDLAYLTVGNGRPLSRGTDALKIMYDKRLPLYRAAADLCVDNNSQADLSASRIIKFLNF